MSHTDPNRPRYHLTTDNWMNDPIPFWHDGAWHVYFQHNPNAAVWGDMHWGHAVSRDLIHWETLPVALAPTPGGADQDGVWTGCVTRRPADGKFLALYTGIPRLKDPFTQVQCVAESDDLVTWSKPRAEPIIAAPPEGYGACFRDPQVFDGPDGSVYMVVGGELPGGEGGVAFLYRADDASLERWTYLCPLFVGDRRTGHDFECPDFFPLGDGSAERRWVLLTSRDRTWWHTGRLTGDMRFERDAFAPCDTGAFYAGKSCVGPDGARVLFGWLREERPVEEQAAAGWSGVLSLPRLVTVGPDGHPRFAPAPELPALRAGSQPFFRLSRRFTSGLAAATADDSIPLAELPLQAEVTLRVTRPTADIETESPVFGLAFSDATGTHRDIGSAPVEASGEPLDLRLFLDGSVLEVFVGGRVCWTQRHYWNAAADRITLCVNVRGGTLDVAAEAWNLTPEIGPSKNL